MSPHYPIILKYTDTPKLLSSYAQAATPKLVSSYAQAATPKLLSSYAQAATPVITHPATDSLSTPPLLSSLALPLQE